MALPTPVKTWTVDVNNTVAALAGTGALTCGIKMMILKEIKDAMVASGEWTVVYSCNARVDQPGSTNAGAAGSAGDAVDRWSTADDFLGALNAGAETAGRWPWMVLQNASLGGGTFQVCFASTGGVSATAGSIVVSPSAGFTGGAVNARPTATDEIALLSSATVTSGNNTTHQVHVWTTTDGECTSAQVWRGGTNMCTFLYFGKPQDVVSGWTNPSVSLAHGASSGIAITYVNLCTYSNRARTSGTIGISFTGETDRSAQLIMPEITDIGTVINDLEGTWPFFGIGIASKTVGSKGRHGSIFDMWWKPVSVNDADTFPNDAANRDFVATGPIIMPYTGDATVLLLS